MKQAMSRVMWTQNEISKLYTIVTSTITNKHSAVQSVSHCSLQVAV